MKLPKYITLLSAIFSILITAGCSKDSKSETMDFQSNSGFPFTKFGSSESNVKSFEIERGNELFSSGKVKGEKGMTYLTFLGKQLKTHKSYEYFFHNGKLDKVQTYTTFYEKFWTLEGNGKPTEEGLKYFNDLGFKFYGWNNKILYPTVVCWNKEKKLMLTFGPRLKEGVTLLMFEISECKEEPVTVDKENIASIVLHTQKETDDKFQISIISAKEFKVDWGDGKPLTYKAGQYIYDKMLSSKIFSKNIIVYGSDIEDVGINLQKVDKVEFKACVNLKEVRLLGNNIENINLTACPNLTFLNISSNKLQSLNLANLSKLSEVHCFKNRLNYIKLPKNLTLLYAYKNELTNIDLTDLQKLEYLNLTTNKLESLNISNNPNLVEIQAGNNEISNLNLCKSYPKLLSVFLHKNLLKTDLINQIINSLPDVKNQKIEEDEAGWKCILNIKDNPGTGSANLNKAKEKGWKI